jgi:hypothetical protein
MAKKFVRCIKIISTGQNKWERERENVKHWSLGFGRHVQPGLFG